jgi:carboxylesterase type B
LSLSTILGTDILQVFVYIYGGAMVTGSSSNPLLSGHNFARKSVIMVSFNHRESLFASPNSAELEGSVQNFGILDVEMAMEWVFANIRCISSYSPIHCMY